MKLHLVFELAAAGPPSAAIERMPRLEKLIARGDRASVPADTLDRSLIAMFGYDSALATPNAALLALGEGLDARDGYWLRADPVCLAPTSSRLTLQELPAGSLSPEEARALGAALAAHFAADAFVLFTPHPQRWYLRLAVEPDLRTLSPAECAGTLQESNLPTGGDSPRWKRMITEVQMLLHAHPINAAREAQGRPSANAVWPWGGGRLPPPGRSSYDSVWSDDLLARGLARAAGIASHAAPQNARAVLERAPRDEHALVVLRGDAPPAPDAMAIDDAWAGPLVEALAIGQLAELTINAWTGRTAIARRVERSHLRRWWRRRRALPVHG